MKIVHSFHKNISYIIFEVEDQSEAVQVAVLEAQLTNLFQINNANDAVLDCIGRLEVKIFLCFYQNIPLFSGSACSCSASAKPQPAESGRVETSHWSRSVQILRSHWLRSRCSSIMS